MHFPSIHLTTTDTRPEGLWVQCESQMYLDQDILQ